MFRKYSQYLCLLGGFLFIASIIIYSQKEQMQKTVYGENIDYYQQEKTLATKIEFQNKIPDFGFSNLIGDWTYLQFIQYFGDGKAREVTGYSLVPEYFAAMVEQDPNFVPAYLSLSAANSIYAAQPQKTVDYLNKLLKYINPSKSPHASYLWSYKAVDEILFLGDTKSAENSYRMAADWARQRNDEQGELIARRNLETADFLATNPDSKLVRIGAWSFLLNHVHDDKTKKLIINEIKALGAKIVINSNGQLMIKPPLEGDKVSSESIL